MVYTMDKNHDYPSIDVINELSEFLFQKFDVSGNCKTCHNRGVKVIRRTPNADYTYAPCHCLKNKK